MAKFNREKALPMGAGDGVGCALGSPHKSGRANLPRKRRQEERQVRGQRVEVSCELRAAAPRGLDGRHRQSPGLAGQGRDTSQGFQRASQGRRTKV